MKANIIERKLKHRYVIKLTQKEANCLVSMLGQMSEFDAREFVKTNKGVYIKNFVGDLYEAIKNVSQKDA